MSSLSTTPKNEETTRIFSQMIKAENDEKPTVEMNEETSRDLSVIWASIEATAARWRGDKEIFFPGMPKDRKAFWGSFATDHHPESLPVVEEFIGESSGDGKVAIDLGCGSGPSSQLLINRGWRVLAVDYSRDALDTLKHQNQSAVTSGQLKVIECDITTYTPSEPADLVVAADILSYVDPTKFRSTWTKIHDTFLKEKGFFIGTLFRSAITQQQVPSMNLMKEMGAWFLPDRRMVRPLLTSAGYQINTCRYRIDDPSETDHQCIQFIAEKV